MNGLCQQSTLDDQLLSDIARCMDDSMFAAKYLFPDTFSASWSALHKQIFDLVDSGYPKIAIAAPRGIGKTTIAKMIAAREILFRNSHFIVYLQNSAKLAMMQTDNLKRSLLVNKGLRKLFGDIRISDEVDGMDEEFSKHGWVAYGDVFVLPRGSGQQIRGLNWSDYRPQLIIVDDLENANEVKNDEIRKSQKDWFFSDVMKSVNRYKNDWRFIYIDTLKHEDSLLQTLIDSSDWKSVVLSICTDNFKSLAPSFMSDTEVMEEVQSHREKGLMSVFYMEYMNMPVGGETAKFKDEYFRHYDDFEILDDPNIETVILGDPAKTIKDRADESAVMAIGIDRAKARLYVRDIVNEKFLPDQFYDTLFSMADRFRATAIGVEVTSLNEYILQPLKNEMFRKGKFYELVELKPRTSGNGKLESKDERIFSTVQYYRQGYVYHNRNCCGVLEAQLLAMPRSKRKDVADVFSYIVQMLERGDRYFEPAEHVDERLREDEFAGIDYDPPVQHWRQI